MIDPLTDSCDKSRALVSRTLEIARVLKRAQNASLYCGCATFISLLSIVYLFSDEVFFLHLLA